MNALMEYERSAELAEAKKGVLVGQTNSQHVRSAMLALVFGTTAANLFVLSHDANRNYVQSAASSATNAYPAEGRQSERAIASELVRVFGDLASRQVEMEDLARRVLYKRMRELYRR